MASETRSVAERSPSSHLPPPLIRPPPPPELDLVPTPAPSSAHPVSSPPPDPLFAFSAASDARRIPSSGGSTEKGEECVDGGAADGAAAARPSAPGGAAGDAEGGPIQIPSRPVRRSDDAHHHHIDVRGAGAFRGRGGHRCHGTHLLGHGGSGVGRSGDRAEVARVQDGGAHPDPRSSTSRGSPGLPAGGRAPPRRGASGSVLTLAATGAGGGRRSTRRAGKLLRHGTLEPPWQGDRGRAVDKYKSGSGTDMLSTTSMEDNMWGGSIGAPTTLSPAPGPTKRRAATNSLDGGMKSKLEERLGGFMLRAHTG